MDNLEYYRKNLRHVVRPDDMGERRDAPHVTIDDWLALYIQGCLKDFAAYMADDQEFGIATAYIEYIEMVVRGERKRQVKLFAHTREARWVLEDAVSMFNTPESRRVMDLAAREIESLEADA